MKNSLKKAVMFCILMTLSSLGLAQTFVQSNTAIASTSTTTITVPFTSAQTAGNLNAVAIGWVNTGTSVTSIIDTKGNTYSLAVAKRSSVAPTLNQTIYYAKNIGAGSNTITITVSPATTFLDVRAAEYSGLDKTNPLDATASANGLSSTPNSGATNTASANELIFAAGATQSAFTAAGTGFTSRIINSYGNIIEDRTVSSIGNYSGSGTTGASNTWIMQIATFKAAALPPTVTSIGPASGSIAGGNSVTITGTSFVTGATVTIGGVAATGVTVSSGTSITATVPAHAAGAVNVIVTNPDAQIGTLISGYTYTGSQAIAFVQSNSGSASSGTTVSATYLSTQTPGNLNIVAVGWAGTAATITSVVDTRGNTYVKAVGPTTFGGNTAQSIYYAKNIVGLSSNTVTVTFSTSVAFPDARILEYSGLSTTNPLDVTAASGGVGTAPNSGGRSYTTSFPLTENPISEGGNWVNGGTLGLDWTNVSTTPGFAIGHETVVSPNYPDSLAILQTGAWGSNQTVQETVFVTSGGNSPTTCFQEAEMRLRSTLSAHVSSGYEISFATGGTAGYLIIVRGNGAPASFTYLLNITGSQYHVANGDVIKATIVGNIISAYKNGVLMGTATDSTYINGSPGLGINLDPAPTGCATKNTTYGLTNFTANDSSTATQTATANELVFGAGGQSAAFTGPGSGFTQRILNSFGNIAEDKIVSKVDYYNTYGVSSTGNWIMQMATFKAANQAAPTVTSISPTSGSGAGSTAVTITGTGFIAGATVSLGGVAATGVTVVNSTTITATTAVHSAATVNVVVTNTDSQTGTLVGGYTYTAIPNPPPMVTSISPVSGIASGNISVTITGTGFLAGATVSMGGVAATSVVVVSSTSITAVAPAHATGAVNIVVTNTDTLNGTLVGGFTYTGIPNPAPTVGSILPISGPLAGTSVTITGTGFLAGATVSIGGTLATGVTVVNGTTITATASAHASGLVGVVVTNTDTQAATLSNSFTYIAAPTVSGVSPNNGSVNGGTSVTITGTGFRTGVAVRFGGVSATSIVVVNATTITALTPAATAGVVPITATNTDGQTSTLTNAFTYKFPAPTIASISVSTGFVNGGTSTIVTGTGFLPGVTVTVGGTTALNISLLTSTSISIVTPAHAAGLVSVVVTNTDTQSATLTNSFTYTLASSSPTITSVTPNTGSTSGGDVVSIIGTSFLSGATVTIGGTAASHVTVVNSTSITATTPTHAVGIVDVVATNTDGQIATKSNGFAYLSQSIGTVTTTNSAGSITISGTEQSANSASSTGTAKLTFSGSCIQSCGPFSVTVNGHTDTISYTQGPNAGVQFAQANSTQRAGESSVTALFNKAQGAGNLNIVVVKWNGTPATITSVTDTNGNAYSLIVGPTQGYGTSQSIYYAANIVAAQARQNLVKVTFNSVARFPDVHIYEYKGLGSFDAGSANTGTTNPTDSSPVSTNFNNELIFGAGTVCGTGFIDAGSPVGLGFVRPGSGFIQRQITSYGNLGEDRTVFTKGSYNSSGFVNCSGWVMQTASFWAGVTANNLATSLAAQINADRFAVIRATPIGSSVYLTSKITGPTTNYSLSFASCCNVNIQASGNSLSGGTNTVSIFDTGIVTLVINSRVYNYNYNQGDTKSSVALALTDMINADAGSFVIASVDGKTINLISKSTGSVNYPFSATSITTNSSSFSTPSFTAVPSGPTLTGGSTQHSVYLVWTASVSPSVLGYNIYRSSATGGPYILLSPQITGLSYNDNTVLSGATYYYVITSVSNSGVEGVYSNQVTAAIPSP